MRRTRAGSELLFIASLVLSTGAAACGGAGKAEPEPVVAQLDCEFAVSGHFDWVRDWRGHTSPQGAVEHFVTNTEVRDDLPDDIGEFEVRPAAGRPSEGPFAEAAGLWVVVAETGERLVLAGVGAAPGDADRYAVWDSEWCAPNFVDDP